MVPRRARKQSIGPGTAPLALRMNCMRSASPSSFVTTMPPIMSLCPFRYLVVLCITRSAPSASGCWKNGEAKVLSTTSRAPERLAIVLAQAMSVSRIRGLVGVSIQITLVAGVTASAMRCGSRVSTNEKLRPKLLRSFSNKRKVPPYTFSPQTM